MKLKKRHIILLILFMATFAIRVLFSFTTPYFEDDESYYSLRQVEHISKTGKPFFKDIFIFGENKNIVLPAYYYLLSLFYFILPSVYTLKLVNNLLASTIVITTYLISASIVRKRRVAILVALVASTIPAYISKTLNSLNPASVIYPGIFFMIFLFLRLENEPDKIKFLIPLTLFLVLSSETISLLIFSFVLFLLFNYLSDIRLSKLQKEYLYFLLFFFLWSSFIIYKNAFLEHGISILWQNMPRDLLINYFKELNISTLITSVGIFPFIFGSYVSFKYLFKKKSKRVNLFVSVFLSSFFIFILRLDASKNSILFIGASLIILFGVFIRDFLKNLSKTKLINKKNLIYLVFFSILITTQILPGLIQFNSTIKNTPDKNYFDSLEWIKTNSSSETIVLSSLEEGHRIAYFSNRKVILNSNFLLVENVDEKVNDIRTAYTSRSKVDIVKILEKYNIKYVFISDIALNSFRVENAKDILDCLDLVYSKNISKVYVRNEEKCSLKRL